VWTACSSSIARPSPRVGRQGFAVKYPLQIRISPPMPASKPSRPRGECERLGVWHTAPTARLEDPRSVAKGATALATAWTLASSRAFCWRVWIIIPNQRRASVQTESKFRLFRSWREKRATNRSARMGTHWAHSFVNFVQFVARIPFNSAGPKSLVSV